jgi:hypothetical protein
MMIEWSDDVFLFWQEGVNILFHFFSTGRGRRRVSSERTEAAAAAQDVVSASAAAVAKSKRLPLNERDAEHIEKASITHRS